MAQPLFQPVIQYRRNTVQFMDTNRYKIGNNNLLNCFTILNGKIELELELAKNKTITDGTIQRTTISPTLVIENQQIINTFDGCDFVTSIIFDQSGYMATSCYGQRKLYLYDNNLSYTGKSISIDYDALTIAFDSKGRFVVVSSDQISIYY